MPLLFDVTFRRDTDTRLRMEYTPEYDCFRTEAIAYGTSATNLWTAMKDVVEFYFDLDDEERFTRLLTDEYAMIRRGITHDQPRMKLQPLLGRFLSIMHGDGRHPLSITPGCTLKLFWAGPGTAGIILEDEIETITEVRRT